MAVKKYINFVKEIIHANSDKEILDIIEDFYQKYLNNNFTEESTTSSEENYSSDNYDSDDYSNDDYDSDD